MPALTAQSRTAASSPFRFGAIYMPNGVFPDTWHPDEVGSDFQFKPVMQPLEPFRDQLVTVSKMKAPWGASVHLGASSAFLNGVGPVGTARGHRRRLRQDSVEEDRRSVHRRRSRRRHAAAFDRGRHRGHGHRGGRLRRVPVHLLQRAVLARRHQPAAGRHQPARHLRADVRRDRLHRAARRAAEGEAEPARLGHSGNRQAAAYARRARPRHPRRVSQQHPPGRAAARSDGNPARRHHRQRRGAASACPRRSTIT